MDVDDGFLGILEGIAECDAVVRQVTGVDDRRCLLGLSLPPIDQLAFVIRLKTPNLDTDGCGPFGHDPLDLFERDRSIDVRDCDEPTDSDLARGNTRMMIR
jgi:hypothetical protein